MQKRELIPLKQSVRLKKLDRLEVWRRILRLHQLVQEQPEQEQPEQEQPAPDLVQVRQLRHRPYDHHQAGLAILLTVPIRRQQRVGIGQAKSLDREHRNHLGHQEFPECVLVLSRQARSTS